MMSENKTDDFESIEILDGVGSCKDLVVDSASEGDIMLDRVDECREEHYEFIINQKGNTKFYDNGFGFYKKRSVGDKTNWECERKKQGCSVKASTIQLACGSHVVERCDSNHNHIMDPDRKLKFAGRHRMKLESVKSPDTLPITISQKAIKENCHLADFGSSSRLRGVIGYTRRKLLNKYPSIDPEVSDDPLLPVKICQSCFRKAIEGFQFIRTISESQDAFTRETSPTKTEIKLKSIDKVKDKVSNLPSAHEILKKMKQAGSVSIKRVKVPSKVPIEKVVEVNAETIVKTEDIVPVVYLEEVESEADSTSEYTQSGKTPSDSDSDYEYEPKKSRSRSQSTPQIVKPAQNSNKDVYIDAPISFTCAKCKISFNDFCTLSRHMKQRVCISIEDEILECELCGKQFKTKKSLHGHIRTHQPKPKPSVMCEGCGTSFNNEYDLEQHSEAVHRRVVKENCIYRCAHCPDTFNSHLDLLEHVKQHKKDEPKLCEICAKECPNLKSYKCHMDNHRNASKFLCTVCKKGFSKSYLLTQHMHIHTGIKAFTCNVCKRSFAKKDSLRVHKQRKHSNDKD